MMLRAFGTTNRWGDLPERAVAGRHRRAGPVPAMVGRERRARVHRGSDRRRHGAEHHNLAECTSASAACCTGGTFLFSSIWMANDGSPSAWSSLAATARGLAASAPPCPGTVAATAVLEAWAAGGVSLRASHFGRPLDRPDAVLMSNAPSFSRCVACCTGTRRCFNRGGAEGRRGRGRCAMRCEKSIGVRDLSAGFCFRGDI
jgi:hypothetical protein